MSIKLYILSFNSDLGVRDKITSHLDTDRVNIRDWYYCLTNTIFIASIYSAKELTEFLKPLNIKNKARFVITELNRNIQYWGWLPNNAWKFINKYNQT